MINKLKTLICMTLMRLPMAGTLRGRFAVMAGVRLRVPNGEKPHLFVGENVRLDHLNPDGIEIGNWTTLATGLSYFLITFLQNCHKKDSHLLLERSKSGMPVS